MFIKKIFIRLSAWVVNASTHKTFRIIKGILMQTWKSIDISLSSHKDIMPEVSYYNIDLLSYAHPSFMKYFFTNIQSCLHFKKNTKFTGK